MRTYLETAPRVELPEPFLQQLGQLADRQGVGLFVVGGFVRDLFLGISRKDIDFTVIGEALPFARFLAQHFRSKAVVYERFHTALVPIGEYRCEFVGTRREFYEPDSRKPIVKEGTLWDDLRRRDFTINAMAIALNKPFWGSLVDLFGGLRHLHQRYIQTPTDPLITFNEDPLRMLRAARFVAALNGILAQDAQRAMTMLASRIQIVSQERITEELLKLLATPHPGRGFLMLYESGLLQYVFPELHRLAGVELVQVGRQAYSHKDVFRHTLQVVDNIARQSENLWLRLAALLHDIGKSKTKHFVEGVGWTFHGHEEVGARMVERIFRRLKLPLQKLPYVQTLVRLHQRPQALVDEGVTDSAIRRLIVQAGDTLDDLFTLCRADITTRNPILAQQYLQNYDQLYRRIQEIQAQDSLRAFQSPVRGEEIMALCNLPPSPAVGYIKKALEEAILEGFLPNEYNAVKAYLIEHRDQLLSAALAYQEEFFRHQRRRRVGDPTASTE
ncbi:MAG: CCA tRNA nucleotidyltransferase [Candidatus Kapabacteria bacterium]|nr:CCA tRNA nucleotidyltransferase [Candidatus Kapabacteria bacterium]MDW8224730.1 HD domain-containing protein [Bacteroidota bacterium]